MPYSRKFHNKSRFHNNNSSSLRFNSSFHYNISFHNNSIFKYSRNLIKFLSGIRSLQAFNKYQINKIKVLIKVRFLNKYNPVIYIIKDLNKINKRNRVAIILSPHSNAFLLTWEVYNRLVNNSIFRHNKILNNNINSLVSSS